MIYENAALSFQLGCRGRGIGDLGSSSNAPVIPDKISGPEITNTPPQRQVHDRVIADKELIVAELLRVNTTESPV
jgi:hypothetical protein